MSKIRITGIRKLVLYGSALLILAGTAVSFGTGTFCNACPVGFLQISAASGSVPVKMIPAVFGGVLAVYVLGRFFCSWLCTTTLLRSMWGTDKCTACKGGESGRYKKLLPYAVLAASVILSFLLKFPVFCLVCPIGLFFGAVFAFFKLFVVMEPSWNLIIFPAVIFAEVFIFRRWCSVICPVSAVFMLISKIPGPKLRPEMNSETCSGSSCGVCRSVCPEGESTLVSSNERTERCTSCMACRDACPTDSIGYGLYSTWKPDRKNS